MPILSLQQQHILAPTFVVKNKNKLTLNSNVYNTSTRQKYNFHQPSSDLSLYQTVSHKVSKKGDNPKQFKLALKNYIQAHSFYSTNEYFNVNDKNDKMIN